MSTIFRQITQQSIYICTRLQRSRSEYKSTMYAACLNTAAAVKIGVGIA